MSLPPFLAMESGNWDPVLAAIAKSEYELFCEGNPSDSVVKMLEKFRISLDDPFRVFMLNPDSPYFFYQDFNSPSSKEKALATVEFHIERFSPLAKSKGRASLILEELLINATISAPRVAQEEGLEPPKRNCRVRIEWDSEHFWIHVIDPYGVFHRRNFEIAFRPEQETPAPHHGHSGRGLKIVMEQADDLWIRSGKGWGTIVSARISLIKRQFLPKTLWVGFR